MSIEPEDLSDLADEIEKQTDFDHEKLELMCEVIAALEKCELHHEDVQFLANALQSIADELAYNETACDFFPNLRVALGYKYERHVGRR